MRFIRENIVCIIFVALAAVCTFFRIQTDDEIYMDYTDISTLSGEADTSNGVLAVNGTDITDPEGIFAVTRSISLPAGSCHIEVDHENDEDAFIILKDSESVYLREALPAGEERSVFQISPGREINNLNVELGYEGSGPVTIKHILFTRDFGLFYSDDLILGIFLCIGAVLLNFYIKKKGVPSPALVIAAAAITAASFPLLSESFVYGHDTAFHMMRIEGIKDALLSGQFPAMIYPNAAYGHGYLGALYPSLFLYVPAVLRLLGISALNAYRTAFFLINVFSYITAYICGKRISGNVNGAVIAAVLYTLAPFRLTDIYFRSTLGESLALIFFPLVICGIYDLTVGGGKQWRMLFIGMTGLLESHLLSAVFIAAVCGVFFIFYNLAAIWEKELRPGLLSRITGIIKAALASVAVNMAFFVPFFYYRSQDLQLDDTIRRFNPARAAQPMYEIFSSIPRLLTDKDDAFLRREMIPTLGLIGMAGIFVTLLLIFSLRENIKERYFFLIAAAAEVFIVYMASDLFPWRTLEKFPTLFNQLMLLEHPWRLFGVVIALYPACIAVYLTKDSKAKAHFISLSASLVILSLITVVPMTDIFFNNRSREFRIDTGNTAYSYNVDYMPREFKDMETLKGDQEPLAYGEASVSSREKKPAGISLICRRTGEGEAAVRVPLLYYKGYRAVDDKGRSLTLYETEPGDICVSLPEDWQEGGIRVYYPPSPLFIIALIFSAVSFIILIKGGFCITPKLEDQT